jgi:hypothetical protein
MRGAAMSAMGMMVLQNCLDLEEAAPVLWSEACPASSHDANLFINTKAEEVSDIKVEEDPVAITFAQIKREHEVS